PNRSPQATSAVHVQTRSRVVCQVLSQPDAPAREPETLAGASGWERFGLRQTPHLQRGAPYGFTPTLFTTPGCRASPAAPTTPPTLPRQTASPRRPAAFLAPRPSSTADAPTPRIPATTGVCRRVPGYTVRRPACSVRGGRGAG